MRYLGLLILLILSGCASTEKQTGNLSDFVMSEVSTYGVDIPDEDAVPAVSGIWTFKRDRYGFLIDVEQGDFDQISTMLQAMLGSPEVSVENNFDGQPQRLFVVKDSGAQIQCVKTKDATQIILV